MFCVGFLVFNFTFECLSFSSVQISWPFLHPFDSFNVSHSLRFFFGWLIFSSETFFSQFYQWNVKQNNNKPPFEHIANTMKRKKSCLLIEANGNHTISSNSRLTYYWIDNFLFKLGPNAYLPTINTVFNGSPLNSNAFMGISRFISK